MKEKKQSNTYPIYFGNNIGASCCIINEKEAIYITTYGHVTQIQYEVNLGGTWIHNSWEEDCMQIESKYTQITKVEFNKSYKKARKILQEKLIT